MAENVLMTRSDNAPVARSLPANIEAEAAFLGAVLIDNRVIEDLQTPLRADHFFEPLHRRIYERILTLVDRQARVTPVTLKPYFEADEAMKAVGGVGYLAQLTGSGAGLIGARDFARQIFDLALCANSQGWGGRSSTMRSTPANASTRRRRSRRPRPRSTALRAARPRWDRSRISARRASWRCRRPALGFASSPA